MVHLRLWNIFWFYHSFLAEMCRFFFFTFSIRQGHLHHLNSIALFMLRGFQFLFMCIYMPCCFISDLSWIFSTTQVNKLIQNTQKISLEYFTRWKFKNQLLVVLEASFQECTLSLDGAAASARKYIFAPCALKTDSLESIWHFIVVEA